MLTKGEIDVLLQYIDFMGEFDDDPDFRDHALSAKPKLEKMKLLETASNSDYGRCSCGSSIYTKNMDIKRCASCGKHH